MSEQIRVGDLVMVAYGMPCCGVMTDTNGTFFTVKALAGPTLADCLFCKTASPDSPCAFDGFQFYDICRLKKINPPPVEETRDTDQEIFA